MKSVPVHRLRLRAFAGLLFGSVVAAHADPRVTVTAKAKEGYTEEKFANGSAANETYVFMQGNYFEGHTVDRSIERMPFRQIAEYLGVQLARQNYLPAPSIQEAKLVIVVHWGTTTPRLSRQDTLGGTNLTTPGPGAADIANAAGAATAYADNPDRQMGSLENAPDNDLRAEANDFTSVADRLVGTVSSGNAATLLGYQEEIHKLGKRAYADAKNDIINFHLTNERYFITLMAYDLKKAAGSNQRHRPVWTLHLNISSPGNNFSTALDRISTVAGQFAGRSTDGLQNVRPAAREGTVRLAPLIIIGEANPGSN